MLDTTDHMESESARRTQPRALTTRLITDFAELQSFAGVWRRLWESNPNKEIFTSLPWLEAWWRGFGSGLQLLAPAVFDGPTLVGIVPLVIEKRTIRFVGHSFADYSDLICEPARKTEVLEAAIAALDESPFPWDLCELTNVSENSLIIGAREALPARERRRTETIVSAQCPTILLGEGRAETLNDILNRTQERRHLRKLQKAGTLRFRHIEDRAQAREHLPIFVKQHIRCRAFAGIRSRFLDKGSLDFYSALIENLDPSTDLRFSILELDDHPIAYLFGFQLDGKMSHYAPTYDIDFFDFSPGQVLLWHLFAHAGENDVKEYDFTVGDEAYKGRFANHVRHNHTLFVYPRTARGRLIHLSHAAKETLRSYPGAFRVAKKAGAAVRAFANRVGDGLRRDGPLELARKALSQLVREAIYSRDEMLVGTFGPRDVPTNGRAIVFQEAKLSDLADAAAANEEYLGDETLQGLRRRIKAGHIPFVTYENGIIVHMNWLRVEDRITATELGEDFVLQLGGPAGIMYDGWTARVARGRGIQPISAASLGQHIRSLGLEPWVYVMANNTSSRRGLAKAGIDVRHRMIRQSYFHWIRRRDVT